MSTRVDNSNYVYHNATLTPWREDVRTPLVNICGPIGTVGSGGRRTNPQKFRSATGHMLQALQGNVCIFLESFHPPGWPNLWSVTFQVEEDKVHRLTLMLPSVLSSVSCQMYIALISFHALILAAFHFVFCFDQDWTSE